MREQNSTHSWAPMLGTYIVLQSYTKKRTLFFLHFYFREFFSKFSHIFLFSNHSHTLMCIRTTWRAYKTQAAGLQPLGCPPNNMGWGLTTQFSGSMDAAGPGTTL